MLWKGGDFHFIIFGDVCMLAIVWLPCTQPWHASPKLHINYIDTFTKHFQWVGFYCYRQHRHQEMMPYVYEASWYKLYVSGLKEEQVRWPVGLKVFSLGLVFSLLFMLARFLYSPYLRFSVRGSWVSDLYLQFASVAYDNMPGYAMWQCD